MAIAINDYTEFNTLLDQIWGRSPLIGFVLYDGRLSHKPVSKFLKISAEWLDELARQSGVYILFPLKSEKKAFSNPSPLIARELGLESNRLPGIVLFATSGTSGKLDSKHFLYVPLKEIEFEKMENMQSNLSDIFSIIQKVIDAGDSGHAALEEIKGELSSRRRKRTKDSIIDSLRSGARIVLKEFPEKFITSFAESLGKALAAKAG